MRRGCTIAFMAVPTGVATDGDVGRHAWRHAGQPGVLRPARSLRRSACSDYQDSTLGTRPASYRDWLYACADGSRWPVEQYVADNAPAVVLYSSHATPAVHAVLTQIAKTAQLPAISAPLRLSDLGIRAQHDRHCRRSAHHARSRRPQCPTGLINDSPQTYAYDVPTAAVPNGADMHVGGLVQLNTNGTAVTRSTADGLTAHFGQSGRYEG